MATEILEVVNFDNALELIGGRELIGDGSSRVAASQNPIHTGSWRTRNGVQSLYPTVNPIYVWYSQGNRFAIDGSGNVYMNGSPLSVPGYISITNGARPITDDAPPSLGIVPYSFVPGAGTPFKIDDSGNITNWGIAAPLDGMTAVASDVIFTQIDTMAATTGWTESAGTLTQDTSDYTANGGSLQWVMGTGHTLYTLTKSIAIDLSGTATPTMDFDLIEFDWKADQPQGVRDVVVEFDLGTGFTTNYYTFSMPVVNLIAANSYVQSTADLTQVDALVQQFLFNPQFIPTPAIQTQLMADYYSGLQKFYGNAPNSYKTAPKLKVSAKSLQQFAYALSGAVSAGSDQWYHLRIPKAAFTRIGTNTTLDWSSVTAVRFKLQNLSGNSLTAHFDNLYLSGGTGLYGQYGYLVSFANTVSGTYSNPNPTTVNVFNVFRQQVTLSNIPISADPQVNARYIWRTVGNGGLLYLDFIIYDNISTTAIDQVSDFIGENTGDAVNSSSSIAIVNTWTNVDGSGSVAVDTSSGSPQSVGDVMIATATAIGTSGATTIVAPTGWIAAVAQFQGTNTHLGSAVFYKVVTTPDIAASFTFTATGGIIDVTITDFSGVNPTTPINVAGSGSSGTTSTAPEAAAIDVTSEGALVLFYAAGAPITSGNELTQPTGFTQLSQGTDSTAFCVGTGYQLQGPALTVGPKTGSFATTAPWTAVMVALAPMASASSVTTATGSLSLEGLTYNNILPDPTISACIYLQGTMFQCGTTTAGTRGNVYYSAVGYAEGVAGFTTVTHDNEPTIGFGVFNNNVYLFTTGGIYLGVNLTQSAVAPVWSFEQILSLPGCTDPQSIISSDLGIIYRGSDGLRFFNGYESPLLVTQILPLFRGESVEIYSPFGTIIAATLGRDEYWFSDGNQTFAISVKAQSSTIEVQAFVCRDVGTPCTALFYEEQSGDMVAGVLGGWNLLEVPVLHEDLSTTPITINLLPKCFYSGEKFSYKVQRVFVDCTTSDSLTVSLITDAGAVAWPIALTGSGNRAISEFAFNQTTHLVGVQITGATSNYFEVFRIAIEADKATST